MRRLKIIFIILTLFVFTLSTVYAGIQCDNVDDSFTTGLGLSTFINVDVGIMVISVKHLGGTIKTGSGTCGREDLMGDDNGLNLIRLDESPNWSAQNWTGTAQCATGTFTATTWTHLVWRHAGGNIELYVNGTLANSVASGNTTGETNPAQICGTGDSADDYVHAEVEEASFYDVDIDANTIYSMGMSRRKGLHNRVATGRWDFVCNHGTSADGVAFIDRAGNGRSLTASDGANNTGMTCQGSGYSRKGAMIQ